MRTPRSSDLNQRVVFPEIRVRIDPMTARIDSITIYTCSVLKPDRYLHALSRTYPSNTNAVMEERKEDWKAISRRRSEEELELRLTFSCDRV